jgi:hypothetical protein
LASVSMRLSSMGSVFRLSIFKAVWWQVTSSVLLELVEIL